MIYISKKVLCNERAMLRWILKTKAEDNVSLSAMYGHLNLAPLKSNLSLNCLRLYWRLEKSDKWINKCTHLEIDGFRGRGRPRKTLSETVTEDMKAWNIDVNNTPDQLVWKKTLKTAMKSPACRICGQVAQNG